MVVLDGRREGRSWSEEGNSVGLLLRVVVTVLSVGMLMRIRRRVVGLGNRRVVVGSVGVGERMSHLEGAWKEERERWWRGKR